MYQPLQLNLINPNPKNGNEFMCRTAENANMNVYSVSQNLYRMELSTLHVAVLNNLSFSGIALSAHCSRE